MNTLTEKQKMVAGLDYFPSDKTLVADRFAARKQLDKLNSIPQDQVKQRANALKSLFGSAGNACTSNPHLNVIMATIFMWVKIFTPILAVLF